MPAIRAILHPTDFSDCSECALQIAATLAERHGARLVVLHVAVPRISVYGGGPVSHLSEAARAQLAELVGELQARGVQTAVEPQVSDGDPAREILRVAREAKCDLIVMGTNGRTGWRRLLMGSVAEAVMRQAECPVLLAKMPSREAVTEPVPDPGQEQRIPWRMPHSGRGNTQASQGRAVPLHRGEHDEGQAVSDEAVSTA
jgi:nucleotide-binding universal stress UspA family protein